MDVGTGRTLGGYVLGGISGTDFLVSALGLTQPKAGRGIVLPSVLIHFWEDPTEIYCDNKSALCFSFLLSSFDDSPLVFLFTLLVFFQSSYKSKSETTS